MSNLVDKVIELYKTETLTLTLAKTGVLAKIDVEGYDKMTIYPEYNSSTIGNTLLTQLKFGNNNDQNSKKNDTDTGLLFHPEPHEVVAADGIATIVGKVRHYVSLTALNEAVPPISMPVNDKEVELFLAEIIPAGAHGVVTVTVRLSRLGG